MDNSVDNPVFDKIFTSLEYRFFNKVFAVFCVRFSAQFDNFRKSILPYFSFSLVISQKLFAYAFSRCKL